MMAKTALFGVIERHSVAVLQATKKESRSHDQVKWCQANIESSSMT